MAVRPFDLSERETVSFVAVSAPRSRRDARRLRQRWMAVGVLAVSAPFVTAVIILGVSH